MIFAKYLVLHLYDVLSLEAMELLQYLYAIQRYAFFSFFSFFNSACLFCCPSLMTITQFKALFMLNSDPLEFIGYLLHCSKDINKSITFFEQ